MVADRDRKRLRFRQSERLFWVWLFRLWPASLMTLMIFKPDTLVRWHRKGFRLYWTWKSRQGQGGRPTIDSDVRELIGLMSRNNIGWGAPATARLLPRACYRAPATARLLPRVSTHGELQMLGFDVSESTVAKYMIRNRKPPSQSWRTFLENHSAELVSVDFFTGAPAAVPTITFKILYVFVILHHERREIIHFNATDHPTAEWTAQQLVEAFPFDTAPRSPWQSPYVERLIGSIRRECLNRVIIINERHLRRQLKSCSTYYHEARTHLSLDKQCPVPRSIQVPDQGNIVAIPHLGGLHHEYRRAA